MSDKRILHGIDPDLFEAIWALPRLSPCGCDSSLACGREGLWGCAWVLHSAHNPRPTSNPFIGLRYLHSTQYCVVRRSRALFMFLTITALSASEGPNATRRQGVDAEQRAAFCLTAPRPCPVGHFRRRRTARKGPCQLPCGRGPSAGEPCEGPLVGEFLTRVRVKPVEPHPLAKLSSLWCE